MADPEKRGDRFGMRIKPSHKRLFARAAKKAGRSIADWMTIACVERAKEELRRKK